MDPARAYQAFYELNDPTQQIKSNVSDVREPRQGCREGSSTRAGWPREFSLMLRRAKSGALD